MKKVLTSVALFALPFLAAAQGQFNTQTGVGGLLTFVRRIIGAIIPILVALAVVFLFVEIVRYVSPSTKPDDKQKALKGIGMSLIAIFIMLTFFAIIRLVADSVLGTGTVGTDITTQEIPTIQGF